MSETILLIDIETAGQQEEFSKLDAKTQKLWEAQVKQSYAERDSSNQKPAKIDEATLTKLYRERAGLHAEFGKVVCVGIGYFTQDGNEAGTVKFDAAVKTSLRVKVLSGEEKQILTELNKLFTKFNTLCSHNGKKFDYPYLARRYLINGMQIPQILDARGKKPWEVGNIDTQDLWRFGDTVYPSLELLSHVLKVQVKPTIDGSEVHEFYHCGREKEIISHCEEDIVTLANVFLKLHNPLMTITR
jgi:DNA polymerase elongation subunit (family B)